MLTERTKISLVPVKNIVRIVSIAFLFTILYPLVLAIIISKSPVSAEWGWAGNKNFSDLFSSFFTSNGIIVNVFLIALPVCAVFFSQIKQWSWYLMTTLLVKESLSGILNSYFEYTEYTQLVNNTYQDVNALHIYDLDILFNYKFIFYGFIFTLLIAALYFSYTKEVLKIFNPPRIYQWIPFVIGALLSVGSIFINNR